MKKEKNGSSAFIEKIKTLNISTSKTKTPAQLAAEKEPTLKCACEGTFEPTHVFPDSMGGKLVRYRHRHRQHDDSAERALSA